MPMLSKNKSGRGENNGKSFFTVLTLAIGLSLVLSYFAFSPNGSYFVDQTGLRAMINGENLNNSASDNAAGDNIASVAAGADSIMLAQNNGPTRGSNKLQNPLGTNGTLTGFLNKLLDVIIMLGSIVIVFMIILAGLRYVLARGNDSEIQKAHMQLTWTAIGAAVLLGAKVISMVIANTVRSLSQ